MKNVETFFENYPKEKKCFTTSDGFVFVREADAESHAGTLKNKEVKPHAREEVLMSEKLPEAKTSESADLDANTIGEKLPEAKSNESADLAPNSSTSGEAPNLGEAPKLTTKTDKK